MTNTILKTLSGVAALVAVAAGASAIAGASDRKAATAAGPAGAAPYGAPMPPGAPGRPPRGGMPFRPGGGPPEVTGATADKVKAAALARYPGAKIERVDQLPDGTYVAHVIKTDGSELHVAVNKQFEVTGVLNDRGFGPPGENMPGHHPHGPDGQMPPLPYGSGQAPPPPGADGKRARPQAPAPSGPAGKTT